MFQVSQQLFALGLTIFLGIYSPIPAGAINTTNTTSPIYPTNKTTTLIGINDGTFGFRNVSYWVNGAGLAIIDGDIIYGPVTDLLANQVSGPAVRRAHSILASANVWPGAIITYNFDSDATDSAIGPLVDAAITEWQDTAPFLAFKKVANSAVGQNGVATFKAPACGGCNSDIGFANAPRTVNLQQTCPNPPGGCGLPEATHELGHLLGLYHEHQRKDRESFVHYNCANLDPACPSGTVMPPGATCCNSGLPSGCCATAGNFVIYTGPNFDASGPYDIHSIMHYRRDAFAIPGTVVLTPAAAGIVVPAVNPSAIDAKDSDRVCKLYAAQCAKAQACDAANCPATCIPTVGCMNKPGACEDPDNSPPCCQQVDDPVVCNAKKAACTSKGCDFLLN